jgi:ribosomal protein S12 methylthiotransferase accessory factor
VDIGLRGSIVDRRSSANAGRRQEERAPEDVAAQARRAAARVEASAAHFRLRPTPKLPGGGARAVRPAETIRRARPILTAIGVTRVAEVTGLDRVGVPNFMTVRPRDFDGGISYYNGKGTTRSAARAGAMMEAVERHGGERCDHPSVWATWAEIRRQGPAVDPVEIIVPGLEPYRRDRPVEWVAGFDLLARATTFVPLNAVLCPYEPSRGRALFYASTNGLASGNSLEEALAQALCEVAERDALSVAQAELELAPALDGVLGALGFASPARAGSFGERYPRIDRRGLPARAARVMRRFERAGLRVYLRDYTAVLGIPTIDCTLAEEQLDGSFRAHDGQGTHPDARVALLRALTEAAQSRVGFIQGGREDLPELRPRPVLDPDRLFGDGPSRPFRAVPSSPLPRVDDDVRFVLRRLRASGFTQAVAVDLTRPEVGLPVVRVVVPRAETWSVFHLHTERGTLGPRIEALIGRKRR